MLLDDYHLTYSMNIHAAENWQQTNKILQNFILPLRQKLARHLSSNNFLFGIGLRLSATAAEELLQYNRLYELKQWLIKNNCYIFTINGFPYGDFHHTRLKENVYLPDWSSQQRLTYTKNLAKILVELAEPNQTYSISTLPGSFKSFHPNRELIYQNCIDCADYITNLIKDKPIKLQLGFEPEPLGLFETTEESIQFFQNLRNYGGNRDSLFTCLGINYDTCHFALQFENCHQSLLSFQKNNIAIAKIQLSNALFVDAPQSNIKATLTPFNENTYLHQVMVKTNNHQQDIQRFSDINPFLNSSTWQQNWQTLAIHYHIPLHSEPPTPFYSSKNHTLQALQALQENITTCSHLEIETYTWHILPKSLQQPLNDQIFAEYLWVINNYHTMKCTN